MKSKPNLLPMLAVLLGAITLVLRWALYTTALDEKNLLTSGHPLSFLVWVCAAAAGLLALVGGIRCPDSKPAPSFAGAAATLVLAVAIGAAVFAMGIPFTLMEKVRGLMGLLCVPALIVAGICRFKGKQPFFACNGLVCVFFTLYLVSRYRIWSGNPQLHDYVFAMLACVALILFSYCLTARDVALGNSQQLRIAAVLSVYLGIAAMYRSEFPWMFLAGAIWALTELAVPRYRGKKEVC